MITCNLTKPEATIDQIRKSYPKLKPTDTALIATAIVVAGRYATARYDESSHRWPSEYDGLTKALMGELQQIQRSTETGKKTAKAAVEEEAVEVRVGLEPNFEAGEKLLGDREDLKTLLGDILKGGVEFVYSPTDIGWQWALDRANWNTLSDGELTRRVKLKTAFEGHSVGVEVGSATKKRASRAKAPVEAPEPAPEPVEVPEEEA